MNHNSEYAAVLDACVLVPMPLCDTLLRLAEQPSFFQPLWSEEILQEVGKALELKLKVTKIQRERRVDAMRLAFREALVKVPGRLLESIECPDNEDRHVIAAAVNGRANAIVTLNVKHFPPEALEPYGLVCETPDDFLIHQYYLNPSLLVDRLEQQAAAIRQNRTYLLKKLETLTPNFTKLIRELHP